MTRRREPTEAQLAIRAGDPICVTQDDGSPVFTTCRRNPWQLPHGDWMLSYEGRTGGYLLTRCWKLEPTLLEQVRTAWGEDGTTRFVNVVASTGGVEVVLSVQPAGHPGQMPDETVIGSSAHDDINRARREALQAALRGAP